MKTRFLSSIYLCHIFLICCTLSMDLRAQDFEQENAKIMEGMDTESFKGKELLNKATALDYQLEPFLTWEKNKEVAYISIYHAKDNP